MKAEELLEMAKGFDEIVQGIKAGDVTADEFREGLVEAREQVSFAMQMAKDLILGAEVEGIGEIQRQAILEQIKEENKNFDYKAHKKLIVKLLSMVDSMDKEIGEELFLPFMIEILKQSVEVVTLVNSDGAKAINKGIKKFYKNRDA